MGRNESTTARLTSTLGSSIVAGVAGTAAMTAASTLESRAGSRGPSTAPAAAAGEVVGVQARDLQGIRRFNALAHWGYGTLWGLFRGTLDTAGLRGPVASLLHFAAVIGTEQAILPALGLSAPTPRYGAKATMIDSLHHAVYATTSGLTYERLRS